MEDVLVRGVALDKSQTLMVVSDLPMNRERPPPFFPALPKPISWSI